MATISRPTWFNYLLLGLSVFLIFCLVFSAYIALPPLLNWLGKLHPLILHFPIVLLLGLALLAFFKKHIPPALFRITVLSVLLTAISGFFLASEITDKGDLLVRHQWLGGGLAILSALWYAFEDEISQKKIIKNTFPGLIILLVLGTGHYGGMITHGEDFLDFPKSTSYGKIPENPMVYQDIAARILDQNCVSCHNPNKKKGELLMTSISALQKGGKSGPAIIPKNAEESEIIRRLKLPKEDEEHMPPKGKKPLSQLEVDILEQWITYGASDTLQLYDLNEAEPLAVLIREFMAPDAASKWANFTPVANSTLERLGSDYLTINRISDQSNALAVDAYLPPEYESTQILKLQTVSSNIVELDLSRLPLGEAEISLIAQCKNLEWLELDGTPLTDSLLDSLNVLSQLRFLKVYSTDITDKSIPFFKKLKNLKQLYLWDTGLSKEGLESLGELTPGLFINEGIEEPLKDFFINTDSLPAQHNSSSK
ncbi:MAG: c-type cytochrome domain-containing protein [Eudoraea sp.]|uniref:c-type cytochrome domain-containing protein n=1 Tax=Eudoraea sp. TaxID=1979955 RepID=UPI003C7347F3